MAEYGPFFPARSHTPSYQTGVQTAQRKSSIETEPRTLYEDELSEAKGVAADIMQTREPEEALEIFTTPSEDVMYQQPSTGGDSKEGEEADMKQLLDKSQEMVTATQRQAQAVLKPALAASTSAPF